MDRNLDIVPISQQVERVQHREREAAVSEFLLRSDLLEDLVPVDIALPYQQCSIFEIAFSVSDRLEQEDIGQRREMENQAVELLGIVDPAAHVLCELQVVCNGLDEDIPARESLSPIRYWG